VLTQVARFRHGFLLWYTSAQCPRLHLVSHFAVIKKETLNTKVLICNLDYVVIITITNPVLLRMEYRSSACVCPFIRRTFWYFI